MRAEGQVFEDEHMLFNAELMVEVGTGEEALEN